MDYRFRDFLFDINSLNIATDVFLDKDTEYYDEFRRKKFLKHKKFLEKIFTDTKFIENYALEIHGVESFEIMNLNDEILSVLGEESIETLNIELEEE